MYLKRLSLLRHIIFFLTCSQVVGVFLVHGQPPVSRLDLNQRRLLLQTAGAFLNVVTETRMDMDSGVRIAARSFALGRSPVVTEGFDPVFVARYGGWIDRDDLRTAKKDLIFASGDLRAGQALLIGAFYAFQPADDRPARDSALVYLEQALLTPVWKRQALILQEKVYFKAGDTTRGLACLREAITDCQRAGDRVLEAKAWNYEGSFYPFGMEVLAKRLGALDKAISIYRQLKDTANESLCLNYQGYMNVAAKNNALSKKLTLEAIRLQTAYHFPYVHYAEDLLGYLDMATFTRKETLDTALAALRNAETVGDTLVRPYLMGRVGNYYMMEEDRYDSADHTLIAKGLPYLYQSMYVMVDRREKTGAYIALFLIVGGLDDLGEYGKAADLIARIQQELPPDNPIDAQRLAESLGKQYEHLHQNALAEKYYLEMIRLEPSAEKIRGDLREAVVYDLLANFYFKTGAYAKARPYYSRTISVPSFKNLYIVYHATIYRNMATIDSALGNYPSAYQFLSQYTRAKDTVYQLSEDKQIDSIRTRFSTAEKERDNALLRAQSATQQKELEQNALVRKVSFGGLALLLLIIALVVNRYRIKQRAAVQLERQKQEIDSKNQQLEKLLQSKEWLLSEIHHRVKNNLQIMMSMLNMQASSMQNQEAVSAIRDSQNRLHAMSLIHQKLYQSADKQLIEMKSFIREFVYTVHDNFYRGSSVLLKLDLVPLQLDVAQAIPLSLILNEAVTNVYKYAFEGSPPGVSRVLSITLFFLDDGETIELRIADNGKGFSAEAEAGKGSLGIDLMYGLAQQMHGQLRIEHRDGVAVVVHFTSADPPSFT